MLQSLTSDSLCKNIENYAKEIGFNLVGFSPARLDSKYLDAYKKWLSQGFHADMTYMEKSAPRADLTKILPGAKSVIVLGLNYYRKQSPLKKGCARIARYAYGRDYHKILGKMLKKLEKYIQSLVVTASVPATTSTRVKASFSATSSTSPLTTQSQALPNHPFPQTTQSQALPNHPFPQTTRSYTDTGPILERAFAEQAGLGWIGKNSCLITREFGSWVFLGIVITTLDLGIASLEHGDKPKNATRGDPKILNSPSLRSESPPSLCGNCTRCIHACPTKAIIAPGVINANCCIAYQTIENKGPIPDDLAKIIKKECRIFGCDICQEVCPHNKARQKPIKKTLHAENIHNGIRHSDTTHKKSFSHGTPHPLSQKIAGDQLDLKELKKIHSDKDFLEKFAGSPLMRAKRKGLIKTV